MWCVATLSERFLPATLTKQWPTQWNTTKYKKITRCCKHTQKISQKAKSIKTAVKKIISPSSTTMLSGKVAMWKAIHIVSIVVTVLWKQHWVICRGTSIDVCCVVKVFCRQRMKIVSCSCRTQTDAQSVDVCLCLIFETISLLLEHRDIHLNMFSVFLQRCLIILTRRWFWTSSGIPACWKQSRFDAPASPSGELFRTSARGLYPLCCAIIHKPTLLYRKFQTPKQTLKNKTIIKIMQKPFTTAFTSSGTRCWCVVCWIQKTPEGVASSCCASTTAAVQSGSWARPRWAHCICFYAH